MPEIKKQNKIEKEGAIRSFSRDLAGAVEEQGGEAFRIARKEETAREEEALRAEKRKKANLFYAAAAGILFIIGLFAFIGLGISPAPTLSPAQKKTIIFFDSERPIDITGLSRDKILSAVRAELEKPAMAGEIANLPFVQKSAEGQTAVDLPGFWKALGITPPDSLTLHLTKNFMYGFHEGGGNRPFLILRNNSYEDAAGGMFNWEDHLLDDLYGILNINISGERADLFKMRFRSETVKNKKARVIRDNDGNIALLYSFLNEQTILIALDAETLEEVLLRLYSPRIR